MARLAYTPAASADIDEITAFSVRQFGFAVTDIYLTGLEAACEQLRRQPERGAIQPRIHPEMRCFIYRRHRIFYRIEADTVRIVRILHHARDAGAALRTDPR